MLLVDYLLKKELVYALFCGGFACGCLSKFRNNNSLPLTDKTDAVSLHPEQDLISRLKVVAHFNALPFYWLSATGGSKSSINLE